jgi:hypothetical protein
MTVITAAARTLSLTPRHETAVKITTTRPAIRVSGSATNEWA